MRPLYLMLALLATLGLTGLRARQAQTSPGRAQTMSAAEKAAWAQEEVYWRALKSRDTAAYMNLWDERFVGWPYFVAEPLGKDGVRKQVVGKDGKWPGSTLSDYKLEPFSVRQYGDGIVITIYRVTIHRPDANGADTVTVDRITYTWMKTAGGWHIIGGMSAVDKQTP